MCITTIQLLHHVTYLKLNTDHKDYTLNILTYMHRYKYKGYIFSTVKLCQFLQYLPKYALYSSSSFTTLKDHQSGMDMERWLTPWRTYTYERPFTQEGNYLVFKVVLHVHISKEEVSCWVSRKHVSKLFVVSVADLLRTVWNIFDKYIKVMCIWSCYHIYWFIYWTLFSIAHCIAQC